MTSTTVKKKLCIYKNTKKVKRKKTNKLEITKREGASLQKMGLSNSCEIEVEYREDMRSRFSKRTVSTNMTIDMLCEQGTPNMYSRVGIKSTKNGVQNKEWVWITDRNFTLQHYLTKGDFDLSDSVQVSFFV